MSMALLVVLASNRAPTADAWQKAMTARHEPVQFSQPLDLSTHGGFLPLTVRGQASGFYFLRESYSDVTHHYPLLATIHVTKPVVWSLGYGAHALECASAFHSASVLVSEFGGVAFEPDGGTFMTAQQLVEAAMQCEALGDLDLE